MALSSGLLRNPVGRPFWRVDMLKRILNPSYDLLLKIITLVMAIGFWLYFEGMQRVSYTIRKKVIFTDTNPGLTPGDGTAIDVKIELKILKKDKKNLAEPDELTISKSLKRFGKPGRYRVSLSPGDVDSSRSIEVTQLTPSDIYVELEKKQNKKVPVELDKLNDLPEFLRIESIELNPNVISISGPASTLNTITSIQTEPFDLSKFTRPEKINKTLQIKNEPWIIYEKSSVRLKMVISERLRYKTFDAIPIRIRSFDPHKKISLKPQTASVTIEGIMSQIEITRESDVNLYIDVSTNKASFYPITYKLPDGISVRKLVPEKIYVEIQN